MVVMNIIIKLMGQVPVATQMQIFLFSQVLKPILRWDQCYITTIMTIFSPKSSLWPFPLQNNSSHHKPQLTWSMQGTKSKWKKLCAKILYNIAHNHDIALSYWQYCSCWSGCDSHCTAVVILHKAFCLLLWFRDYDCHWPIPNLLFKLGRRSNLKDGNPASHCAVPAGPQDSWLGDEEALAVSVIENECNSGPRHRHAGALRLWRQVYQTRQRRARLEPRRSESESTAAGAAAAATIMIVLDSWWGRTQQPRLSICNPATRRRQRQRRQIFSS